MFEIGAKFRNQDGVFVVKDIKNDVYEVKFVNDGPDNIVKMDGDTIENYEKLN